MRDVSKVVGEIVGEIRVRESGGKVAEMKRLKAKREAEKERLRQLEDRRRRGSVFNLGIRRGVSGLGGKGVVARGMECVGDMIAKGMGGGSKKKLEGASEASTERHALGWWRHPHRVCSR